MPDPQAVVYSPIEKISACESMFDRLHMDGFSLYKLIKLGLLSLTTCLHLWNNRFLSMWSYPLGILWAVWIWKGSRYVYEHSCYKHWNIFTSYQTRAKWRRGECDRTRPFPAHRACGNCHTSWTLWPHTHRYFFHNIHMITKIKSNNNKINKYNT